MTPLLPVADYMNGNGVNFADTGSYKYCMRNIHRLAYDPIKGQNLTTIIFNLISVCNSLNVGEILIKGNLPEGELLSRWFKWAEFTHPPITCMHRLRVPTPETMSEEVRKVILEPFITASRNSEYLHMTDHCGHPRPSYVTIEPEDKEQVPHMYGKPIVRDFSHCPMIESMYYAMFGLLESECELFTEEDQFPKLVYVATQR